MKINVKIDCTPEEARRFFGLPDVKPLQDAMVKEMQGRIREAMAAMDPEALMKMWFPTGVQGWEDLQRRFWDQFAGGGAKDEKKE